MTRNRSGMTGAERTALDRRANGPTGTGDVKPWGRWATLGLGVIALLGGQALALAALAWWYGFHLEHFVNLAANGVAVTLIICISTPIQVLLLALMARGTGTSATEYLGLTLPRKSDVFIGIIAVVVFILASNAISKLLGRDIVTQFQLDIYRTARTAGYLPWLWLIAVVVAPIGEETLFRGFLFRGWHRAPGDAWFAIIVPALLWAFIHLQYDLYFMAQVFAMGLVLGWFRWVSGSTMLTILLHGLANGESMLETFMALHA
jgi:membrane protease YdiL (CAAX protease family)